MRAQIRELIRPTMLLAAVLVLAVPARASGTPGRFGAHSNQENQVAHSNQEWSVPGAAMAAGPPAWPVAGAAGAAGLLGGPAPPDAGAQGAPGPPWAGIRVDASGPGGGTGAGRRPGAIVPAPGGLVLLALAAAFRRPRRRVARS